MAYLSVGEEGVTESSCQPHNKREQSNEKWSCAQQGEHTTRFRGRHWNAAKMTLRHKTSSQPLPHHRAREGATYLSSTSRTECMSSTATHPPYAANSRRCAGTTCKSCVREEVISRCRRHTLSRGGCKSTYVAVRCVHALPAAQRGPSQSLRSAHASVDSSTGLCGTHHEFLDASIFTRLTHVGLALLGSAARELPGR
jgi:hypothetical protein